MSDEITVRVTLDAYDRASAVRQTQVYVQIPEMARASWLLPEDHHHFSQSQPWPSVVDSAQEFYEQSDIVTDPDSAAARRRVMAWLEQPENRDEMQAAWEEDCARQHPVVRKLLAENERLRGELLLASTLLGDVSLLVEQARALDDTVLDVDAVAERAGVVEPEPDVISRLFVPVQALREPDEHGLRHTYRLGRDLPAQTTTPTGDTR